MNIEIIDAKEVKLKTNLIRTISQTTLQDENLSFRSIQLITRSVENGSFKIVINKSSDILGWSESYKIWRDWWGISNLYVFPKYRGFGVGGKLLKNQCVRELKDKKVFLASTNKNLFPLLYKIGFMQIELSEIPIVVKLNIMKRYINIQKFTELVTA